MEISYIIPCYKSGQALVEVVNEIIRVSDIQRYTYEIILVNDFSPDNTFELIKLLCKNYDFIKGINLAKNFGQHSAIMAGLRMAKGDIIVCLDDDGQTPPSEAYKLIDEVKRGNDVVIAKYQQKKHSRLRNIGSRINDEMANKLIQKPRELFNSSYIAINRVIVDEITKYENPYTYLPGLLLRSTNNIINVDVIHKERKNGGSGYTFRKLLKLWFNGFTSFSVSPLRVATLIGSMLFIISTIVAFSLIFRKILNPTIQMGYTSIMLTIIFFGAVQLLCVGLLGEYIGRIFICINKSPQYVIKEVVSIEKSEIKTTGQGE